MVSTPKIILVNCWTRGIDNIKPPLGLGYLISYLKKILGFENLKIIDSGRGLFEKISKENPSLVGFTSYTVNYLQVTSLMRQIKEKLGVPVIIGGPHISSLPRRLSPFADVGVIGEGEETFLELIRLYLDKEKLNSHDLEKIKGITFHKDGQVMITEPRELIEPLDRIPPPDRSSFDMGYFLKPRPLLFNNEYLRATTVLTTRGCPYHCIYCQASAFWKKPRMHSADYVADEIKALVDRYQVTGISIADDLFTLSKRRIKTLIELLRSCRILGRVKFLVNSRADLMDGELIELLRELGVVKISLGVESGSERVLKYLKGGSVSVDQNREAIRLANRSGIGVYGCMMLGAPGETREDMAKTVDFIREVLNESPLNAFQVTVTTPLPGTELWDYALEKGYVDEEMDWNQLDFSPSQIEGRSFLINENVDFDEFVKILKFTAELCISRRLNQILSNLSTEYLKRGLIHPLKVFALIRAFFKGRFSKLRFGNL